MAVFGLPLIAAAQLTDTTGVSEGLRGAPTIYKYDARTVAMGDATIADHTYISSININPANLSFLKSPLMVNFNSSQNWNNNLKVETLTVPVFMSRNHHIAGQVSYHHRGPEQTNFLNPSPQPNPELELFQADFAYAWSYEDVLSLGIMGNFTFAEYRDLNIMSFFPAVGVLYAPSDWISYAMAMRGLGLGESLIYEIDEQGETRMDHQDMRESLEIGATLHLPVDQDRTVVSISLANEKRFGESGLHYKGGVEVKPIPYLALRTGVILHQSVRNGQDETFTPRFGIGIGKNRFMLDYGISYRNQPNERFHQLGVAIRF